MGGWIRPSVVPYPAVWHTFQARDVDSDRLVTYRVQDLPEERFGDAIAHMRSSFAYDEPTCRAKNLAADTQSMDEMTTLWQEFLKDRVTLVCFREGSDEIVGMNMLAVSCRDDRDDYQCTAAIWRGIYDTVSYVSKRANVFERYQVDAYLTAMGLSVSSRYRGRGVATEILRARVPLCRAIGLRLTSTCFTAIASQAAAAKAGFEETHREAYADLPKVDPRFDYGNLGTEFMKVMSLRIV